MRYLFYFFFVSLIYSCGTQEETDQCHNQKYGEVFTIHLGESVCFSDGNSFEVKAIIDEFCCCYCKCAWAGELDIMVETTDQLDQKDLLSFGSSTYSLKNQIFEGYHVSKIEYLYNDTPNSLPVCDGEYESNKVKLSMEISPN